MLQCAILIAGPTASGKSALALAIARSVGGLIVNADSMQVYRDLRVLTARPDEEALADMPHRLYGHVDAADAYSTGRWIGDVANVLVEARETGRIPVIVGGTGLYFKALTEGLSPIPAVPGEVRAHWRGEAQRLGSLRLHEELARRDPDTAAQLASSDTQRVTRALEVLAATGRGLSQWQLEPGVPVLRAVRVVRLVAMPERATVVARAERRLDEMMACGALEEVRGLMGRRLDAGLPVMRALGVAPLMRHLAGEIGRDAAVDAAKGETRAYIKRQLTWLRRYMIAWDIILGQEKERICAYGFTLNDD